MNREGESDVTAALVFRIDYMSGVWINAVHVSVNLFKLDFLKKWQP